MADLESLQDTISKWSGRNGGYPVVKEIALSGPEATELLAEEMRRFANERGRVPVTGSTKK
jgi:hypothetical protein